MSDKGAMRAPVAILVRPQLSENIGTAAITRVIIESTDTSNERWSTVGVSTNVIDASYNALHDSITYLLLRGAARG